MPHTNSPADRPPGKTQLGAAIRAQARRHEPDSAAIRARVERAMADGGQATHAAQAAGRARHARRRQDSRLAGASRRGRTGLVTPARVATAGVAALSVAGGGAWFLASQRGPAPTAQPAQHARITSRDSTSARAGNQGQPGATTARSAAPVPGPEATVTPSATVTTVSGPAGGTRIRQNFLSSDGTIDPASGDMWGQSEVTLKNTSKVTALRVVLRLADTQKLASAGSWTTVPNAEMTITVTTSGGMLVYTFVLNAGATLSPGQYEFAAQYTHGTGARSSSGDTYQATASAGQSSAQVYGSFP